MMLNILWLGRVIPFPQTAGDRIYSVKLATAVAASGAAITFAGLASDAPPQAIDGVDWHVVPGLPLSQPRGLFSVMPLVAARFSTHGYKAAIARLAADRQWDAVIVDQYGMGWVLKMRRLFGPRTPIFVFIAHDHEESVTRRQWRDVTAGWREQLYFLQNYLKTRRFERATARACDLVTAVTPEDVALFKRNAPQTTVLLNQPAYGGQRTAERRIDATVRRSAVLFGSYQWSAKQANLKLFMEQAGRTISAAGIELAVVGDMSSAFKAEMQERYEEVTFTGFVEDPGPYLEARVALVPEPIGGGFKLKFLEYIFRRLPIVALATSATGLPEAVRKHMLLYPNLPALAAGLVEVIDDTEELDAMQRQAFEAAADLFNWSDRGAVLHQAMTAALGKHPVGSPSCAGAKRVMGVAR